MTLPESVLLLVLGERGTVPLGLGGNVSVALAGGQLLELVGRGLASARDGRIVTRAEPVGDELLDAAASRLRQGRRPPTPRAAVSALAGRALVREYVHRLVARGVLGEDPAPAWWRRGRHPVLDTPAAEALRSRAAAAALRPEAAAEADVALAALIGAAGLGDTVWPGRDGREVRTAAGRLVHGRDVPRAVREALGDDGLVVMVAVGDAGGSSSSGGDGGDGGGGGGGD